MASEKISLIFGRGESLAAIGGEKSRSGRPLIALFAFPGCAFSYQGLIRMIVQDSSPDIELDTPVGGKSLFVKQETILSSISTAEDNLLLALCFSPEVDSVA